MVEAARRARTEQQWDLAEYHGFVRAFEDGAAAASGQGSVSLTISTKPKRS